MTASHDGSRAASRTPSSARHGRRVGLAAALCVLPAVLLVASQKPAPQQAPKTTAATALSFSDFHGLPATVDYLQKVAAAHPGITDLVEIGRSAGDRPIYVLVVSNMKTGTPIDKVVPLRHPRAPAVNNVIPMKAYQAKPGQWIDGGLHGSERVATEACLYIIDKLVSGYGSDAAITKLVDDNAFYIAPVLNPDLFAQAAPPRDATGSPNGNFPEGWWKDDNSRGGEGEYPSSTPEAHAILEFFTNHTNILLVQSFDAGGTTTFRPFARWPESRVDVRDVAVLDRLIGRKYLELVGETVPASWNTPMTDRAATAGGSETQAGRGRGAAVPQAPAGAAGDQPSRRPAVEQARAWRSAYTNAPAGYGVFIDWAYGQFGAYAMSTQLPDVARDGLAKVCETAWQFERFKATLLPHVEITDATAKVLYTTNQATRATATPEGDAVVVKRTGAPARFKVVQVTATVENTGELPTGVARAPQLRGNREDVIWLVGDKVTFLQGSRWLRLGLLPGTAPLPGAAREAEAPAFGGGRGGGGRGGAGRVEPPLAQLRQQRPAETPAVKQVGTRRIVTWLVAVEGDTPLKLALTSQRGGTKVKDLAVQ